MSTPLGTLAIVSGQDATFTGAPPDGIKAVLIGNESGLTCTISMESGGVSKTLYPGLLDWFSVRKGFNGNIKVHPTTLLSNASSFPASTLVFDAIGLNDEEHASMYPIPLPGRNTNVGNAVSTVLGISSAIQNDGSVAGTSIIESTVQGDGSSAVTLTNDAVMVLGDAAHAGSLTTKGPTSLAQTIKFVNTNPVHIQQLNGADFIFESPAATEVGRITNGGVFDLSAISSSKIKFLVGTLSRISKFAASVTTTPTNFPHGLGVTPDLVLLQQTGGSSTIRTAMYDDTTMDATNVNITGSSSFNVQGLAIKF